MNLAQALNNAVPSAKCIRLVPPRAQVAFELTEKGEGSGIAPRLGIFPSRIDGSPFVEIEVTNMLYPAGITERRKEEPPAPPGGPPSRRLPVEKDPALSGHLDVPRRQVSVDQGFGEIQ